MSDTRRTSAHEHLERLRSWRNPKSRDLTLGFLAQHVERQVERPYRQLTKIQEPWRQLIPNNLIARCALAGLVRGVLTVHVPDSATKYALDRLLRGGVERNLRATTRVSLRRIQIKVVPKTGRAV